MAHSTTPGEQHDGQAQYQRRRLPPHHRRPRQHRGTRAPGWHVQGGSPASGRGQRPGCRAQTDADRPGWPRRPAARPGHQDHLDRRAAAGRRRAHLCVWRCRHWHLLDGERRRQGWQRRAQLRRPRFAGRRHRRRRRLGPGRGQHGMAYTAPSATAPDVPRRAFASNLIEGSITVIGNDPADASTYLKIITTLNLCDPAREDGMRDRLPNNAFPHGMVYSAATGKIYNLNNGYGSVVVIDPRSNTIEASYKMQLSSNLQLRPNGRILNGKGVDRKPDPDHLHGHHTLMNTP